MWWKIVLLGIGFLSIFVLLVLFYKGLMKTYQEDREYFENPEHQDDHNEKKEKSD